jgi:hypothetical protein
MQFESASGVPLSGGKVYTYAAGTTTPQATYTDYTGATPNANPVILDSRGEAAIWLGSASYKFKLTDANDVEIWVVDYISAPTSGVSPILSGNVIIDSDTPGPALKITQTGTGSVLRVQDSADPDATPFIIDGAGNVGIGTATPSVQLEATGAAKIGSLTLTSAPLPVASGGTGVVTLTANNLLIGNGVSAVSLLAPGAAGNTFYSDGTAIQSGVVGFAPEGAYRNLRIQATGNTSITVTADSVVVYTSNNIGRLLNAVSLTLSTTTSGANGLDTGTIANNTWYAVWVIYDPSTPTVAGLISTSATAPTLPTGYTYKARVGWVRYATAALARTLQVGHRAQYVVTAGSQTPNSPIMASGVAGNVSTPIWIAVAWGAYAPSTSTSLSISIGSVSITGQAMLAPNNSYGSITSSTNPAPLNTQGSNYALAPTAAIDLIVESSNVFWASNTPQGFMVCRGWTDNV